MLASDWLLSPSVRGKGGPPEGAAGRLRSLNTLGQRMEGLGRVTSGAAAGSRGDLGGGGGSGGEGRGPAAPAEGASLEPGRLGSP